MIRDAHGSERAYGNVKTIKKKIFHSVGSQSEICILEDPRIPSSEGFKPPSERQLPENFRYVGDFFSSNSCYWKDNLVRSIFPPEVANVIFKIHITPSVQQDALVRIPSKSGDFSVKSAYRHAHQLQFKNNLRLPREFWDKIWCARLHDKGISFGNCYPRLS